MSSSNRTETLGLNSWLGSDRPERADFNADNEIIDATLAEHFESTCHITESERNKWNTPYYFGVYFGDGNLTRTITTNCPFNPTWGLVFKGNAMPATTDFSNSRNLNHFAIVSVRSNMSGVELSGQNLKIRQSGSAIYSNEYSSINEYGATYCYILFR